MEIARQAGDLVSWIVRGSDLSGQPQGINVTRQGMPVLNTFWTAIWILRSSISSMTLSNKLLKYETNDQSMFSLYAVDMLLHRPHPQPARYMTTDIALDASGPLSCATAASGERVAMPNICGVSCDFGGNQRQ